MVLQGPKVVKTFEGVSNSNLDLNIVQISDSQSLTDIETFIVIRNPFDDRTERHTPSPPKLRRSTDLQNISFQAFRIQSDSLYKTR